MHPNPPLPKFIFIPLTIILIVVTVYYWIDRAIENYKYPPATQVFSVLTDKKEYKIKENLVLTVRNDQLYSIFTNECESFILEQKGTNGVWAAAQTPMTCSWKKWTSAVAREIKKRESASYPFILNESGVFRISLSYRKNCSRSGCRAPNGRGGVIYSNEFIVK